MTRKFKIRVMTEGIVDTKKYRYVYVGWSKQCLTMSMYSL